ncbi:MAG: hypothetical protein RIT38_144 [Bacteroidota bacterium]|jgi:hypothetical protein
MKNVFAFFLLLILLTQTFSRSLALADYMVNLEAYKKACINKAKPKLQCNGKCQMLKKVNQQEAGTEKNTTSPSFNHFELALSSKSFFPKIHLVSEELKSDYYTYKSEIAHNYVRSIFHPPGV